MAGRSRASMTVVVMGIEEIDSLLKGFLGKEQKSLIVKATKMIASKVANDARSRAPRKSGLLAESVKVAGLRRVRAGEFATKHKIGAALTVGGGFFTGDTFYGGFLEYGTKDRYHHKKEYGIVNGRRRIIAKQLGKYVGKIDKDKFAFIRPAMEANREYARNEFINALHRAIYDLQLKAQKSAVRARNKIFRESRNTLQAWGLEKQSAKRWAQWWSGA